MINIAICDKEKNFIKEVYNVLINVSKKKKIEVIIDIFENENKFLSKINNFDSQYNIVFINIDEYNFNNNINGLDIAKYVKKVNITTQVIFFSRSQKYVFDGYEMGISNYFLKPIDNKLNTDEKEKIEKEFLRIVSKIYKMKKDLFIVKKRDSLKVIHVDDILFFEANNRKIRLFSKNGSIDFYDKIDDLEKKLNKKQFIRCHRGFLINPDYIKEIKKGRIYLNNDYIIPISRLRMKEVKEEFINYLNNNNNVI